MHDFFLGGLVHCQQPDQAAEEVLPTALGGRVQFGEELPDLAVLSFQQTDDVFVGVVVSHHSPSWMCPADPRPLGR